MEIGLITRRRLGIDLTDPRNLGYGYSLYRSSRHQDLNECWAHQFIGAGSVKNFASIGHASTVWLNSPGRPGCAARR